MAGSIEVRNLRVVRGEFTLTVDELAIRKREVFAILGSTGSGSSASNALPIDTLESLAAERRSEPHWRVHW